MQTGNGTASLPEETNEQLAAAEEPKTSKPFFRRLSFKGLRKGKVRIIRSKSKCIRMPLAIVIVLSSSLMHSYQTIYCKLEFRSIAGAIPQTKFR